MQILAASGCIIEDNISYAGNDLTFSVVESIQECANFASQDEAKGTMGTLGWVFYPDSGNWENLGGEFKLTGCFGDSGLWR